MKKWTQSKTLVFNSAVGALAAAEANLHVLQPLVAVDLYQVATFALVVGNAALRVVTSQAVSFRGPEQ